MFEYPMKPSKNPEISDLNCHKPVLKVIGLGGGGSNAVERMMELDLQGIEFIAANTDLQALKNNPAPTKVLLGSNTTRGLGAGGDPSKGWAAAEESRKELAAALSGADMVFLTAGMGGGTGTGSIPVAAENREITRCSDDCDCDNSLFIRNGQTAKKRQ